MIEKSFGGNEPGYANRLTKFLRLPIRTRWTQAKKTGLRTTSVTNINPGLPADSTLNVTASTRSKSGKRVTYLIKNEGCETHFQVYLQGKINRRTVLALIEELNSRCQEGHFIRFHLHNVQKLDMAGFACLAMLCTELEQKGLVTFLSGVPRKLQQASFEANLHHLVSFE